MYGVENELRDIKMAVFLEIKRLLLKTSEPSELQDWILLLQDPLHYMHKFAQEYPDADFVQETLSKLPWTFHQILLDKVAEKEVRLQYVFSAIKNNLSLEALKHKIESGTP